jgi:hypothetical protein
MKSLRLENEYALVTMSPALRISHTLLLRRKCVLQEIAELKEENDEAEGKRDELQQQYESQLSEYREEYNVSLDNKMTCLVSFRFP